MKTKKKTTKRKITKRVVKKPNKFDNLSDKEIKDTCLTCMNRDIIKVFYCSRKDCSTWRRRDSIYNGED